MEGRRTHGGKVSLEGFVGLDHRAGHFRPLRIIELFRNKPTVCLNVISLVSSSCEYIRGEIESRAARPRSWDRPLYAFRGGRRGAGASSTDAKIAVNIERGF